MNRQSPRFLPVLWLLACGVTNVFCAAQQSPRAAPASTPGVVGGVVAGNRVRRPPPPAYSGDRVTVRTQTLADGTTITQRNLLKEWRDSEGRRREEFYQFRPGDPEDIPVNIIITDPVAGVRYYLSPPNHLATKSELKPRVSPPTTQANPAPVNRLPAPPPPTAEHEDLGMQEIEGVNAKGARATFTIPAGAQGNDRPIQYTHESWYSEELQVQVMLVIKDPRSGEMVTRLTNINRDEPALELFQVPADYTIQETQTVVTPPTSPE